MQPEIQGSSSGVDGLLYRLTLATRHPNLNALHDFLMQEGFSATVGDPIGAASFIHIECDQSKPFADGEKEIESIKQRFYQHQANR